MPSQAGAYGSLLFGGILLAAAAKGDSIRNVLSGVKSPIRPLTSPIPTEFASATGGPSASTRKLTGRVVPGSTPGAAGAVAQARRWIGTNEGSKRQSEWASRYGVSASTAWCSEFVAEVLRSAGVTDLPANALYSGAWLNWSGGQNLHTTNIRRARPGDILVFDWGDGGITDHVGIYAGGGQYIAGNNSDNSVGATAVDKGALVGIVRPKYPGTGGGLI